MNELTRVDLRWNNGPCLVAWTADGREHWRRLTPRECFAIIGRLAGYLATLHQAPGDRTAETIAANPEMTWLQGDDAA